MYNTDFKVKYYDIEKELITKYDNEPDGEYTKQDIFDVCNKLSNCVSLEPIVMVSDALLPALYPCEMATSKIPPTL